MLLNDYSPCPRASVIIPTYNTGRYIGQALQSALDQTERSIEVIIVDDCSTDDTLEIIRSFLDERVKVLMTGCNSGPSHARNVALQEARGEWIAILDSDDWYAPERIARLLDVADAQSADLVADDLHMIQDDAKRPWGTLFSQYGSFLDEVQTVDAVNFVESNLPGLRHLGLGSTKPLIRRSFLEQHGLAYNESLRCGEDFDLYLMCLVHGARFTITPEVHYFYRSRQGSIVTKDILNNLGQLHQGNLSLLQHDLIAGDAELVDALTRRLALIKQRIMYYRIVQPLKERSLSTAFLAIMSSGPFLLLFAARIPGILRFRFFRRLRKIKNTLRASGKKPTQPTPVKAPVIPIPRIMRDAPIRLKRESVD